MRVNGKGVKVFVGFVLSFVSFMRLRKRCGKVLEDLWRRKDEAKEVTLVRYFGSDSWSPAGLRVRARVRVRAIARAVELLGLKLGLKIGLSNA